jgi:hypothetical protein
VGQPRASRVGTHQITSRFCKLMLGRRTST